MGKEERRKEGRKDGCEARTIETAGPLVPLQLLLQRLHMVCIDMRVANHMDQFSRFISGNMRYHVGEEGIGGNVKGHTKAHVSTPLVHLTEEGRMGEGRERLSAGEGCKALYLTIQLALGNIELRHHVARGQRHVGKS